MVYSLLADVDVVEEMKLSQQDNDLPSREPALKKLVPIQPFKVTKFYGHSHRASSKGRAGNIEAVVMCVLLHS